MSNRAGGGVLGRFVLCALVTAVVGQACSDDAAHPIAFPDAGTTVETDASAGGRGQGGAGIDATVTCTAGSVQCLGDRATQICTLGHEWAVVDCGAGERCVAGHCSTAQPCKPGEKVCATSTAAKECDADGTAWVVSLCGDQKICQDGACVLDVKGAPCEPGETQCADTSTQLRCLPEGKGFESVTCPKSAPCSQGACRGPVCAVGETRCAGDQFGNRPSAVQTCSDGKSFAETPCSDNAPCAFVTENGVQKAECHQRTPCFSQGQRVCGDPAQPSSDQRTSYSECQFVSGNGLAWVTVTCAAPASCDGANPGCTADCTPGEKRCAGPGGYQECTPDGKWAAPKDCNAGASADLGCRPKFGGSLPDAECVDAVCAALSRAAAAGGESNNPTQEGGTATSVPANAQGVCEGAQIRLCSADGKLGDARDCAAGACRAVGTGRVGGYLPAACSKECSPGERRCVADGQPLYLECGDDGTWSTSPQSCGSVCTTAVDDKGLRTVLCGDECLPGSSRCQGAKLQKCGDSFKWLAVTDCSLGRCSQGEGGNAFCKVDCVPGTSQCVGAPKDASDGSSSGTDHSAVCTSHGLLPTETTACTGTQTCRTARTGESLGCVECIGPKVAGGNESGVADSRCASSGGGVQACGDDNAWAAAKSCGSGNSCVVGHARSCGQCPGGFVNGACTASALSSTFGGSCQNFGFGQPGRCGTTEDCCSSACQLSSAAFAFCAPDGFSPCLSSSDLSDLGNTTPRTVTGSLLFGDDKFTPKCSFRANVPDAAYRFTAPRASTFSFDTFGSKTDTVLTIVDALACFEVACNDDAQGAASRAVVPMAAGQQVLVIVEGSGDYALHVVDTAVAACGNGFVDKNEMCDGFDLGGQTCASATLGALPAGTLGCTSKCGLDVTNCTTFGGDDGGAGGFRGVGGSKSFGD